MGIAAGLGSAITWAISSTFLGSQTARIDTITLVLLRALFAAPTFAVALFITGAQDELWNMPWNNMWQLSMAGFFAIGSGDLLFAGAFFLIGMSRALLIVMSLAVLFSFVLASIFLGEDPTLQIGIGAVLILLGVYTAALYGQPQGAGSRAMGTADAPDPTAAPRPIAGAALPEPSNDRAGRRWLRGRSVAFTILGAALATAILLYLRARRRTAPPEPPSGFVQPSSPLSSAAAVTDPQMYPPLFTPSSVHATPDDQEPVPMPADGLSATAWTWIIKHRLPIGVIIATLAGLNWAIAIVWLRGASFDVDPVAGVSVRIPLVVGIFAIAAIAYPNSSLRKWNITWRGFIAIAISGVIGNGIASLLILVSIQEVGAGEATTLLSTGPLWGLPLAVIFLRERITRWAVVGAVTAIVGIVLVA
ncbi:MAG: DMT family transporter [Chloroflexi bacterium]|nr:DMT family transporter [Chloroflexota bacterium]